MIYKGFAKVYDQLMLNTPYDYWLENLLEIYEKYNFTNKSILDLACGTGEMSNRLARKGYKVMGVDISAEMLEIAQDKSYNENLKINYINQDIKELELHHTYDSVISYCDGFNYIIESEDLLNVFRKVFNNMNENGLFIFDISSEYKLKEVLGNNIFADTSENITYVWENYYDESTSLIEFDLSIFTKKGDLYEREDESHIQRAYHIKEIKEMLEKSGFELLEVLDTNTNKSITESSERILFIGKKV